ncbi:MAG: AAA family ATPase [Candidatus Omnitrophica bacterium]|nr:AAA family ATPase [Candidatus Omnitrophota bacterium]
MSPRLKRVIYSEEDNPQEGRSIDIYKDKLFNEANSLPENLELNVEFLGAFDLLENTRDPIFVSGKAGTGKSTLLKYFRKNTSKNVVVLAPTGVAAINVSGQTIHSFFRFAPRLIQKDTIHRRRNNKIIKKLDMVIIDEVSMVRADLMDGIDYALRINRDEMNKPFGGAQVVFFGDLFQLPPVLEKEAQEILSQSYESPYFFNAKVFEQIKLRYIELTKIYRQSDAKFINILNQIRCKEHTEEELALLNERVRKKIPQNLAHCVILTTTNHRANVINEERLKGLSTQAHNYEAVITGVFDVSAYPTESCLKLKVGAQVILIKNDPDKRWVNGTIAEISAVLPEHIEVLIGENTYEVPRVTWEKIQYEYNDEQGKIEEQVIGTFEQYPLKLAWAITIHKSQGQTFDNVVIDLGYGAFTHGQVYVALSRCRALEGIILKRQVYESDIIFDERIYQFRNKLLA